MSEQLEVRATAAQPARARSRQGSGSRIGLDYVGPTLATSVLEALSVLKACCLRRGCTSNECLMKVLMKVSAGCP